MPDGNNLSFQTIFKMAYPSPFRTENVIRDSNGPWAQISNNYIVFAVPAPDSQQEPIVIQVLNAAESDMANFEELKNQVLKSLLEI